MKYRLGAALAFVNFAWTPQAVAQGVPQLEKCTLTQTWDYRGGTWGVKNICNEPVSIQFMTQKDKRVVRTQVGPGERFNTGLSKAQINAGWWIFTTCPVGYESSIPFEARYETALIDGQYNCIKK